MSQASRAILKWWWTLPTAALLLLGAGSAYLYYWPDAIQARARKAIEHDLQERFHSDVELADLQIKLLPRLNVSGHGLTLRYHGRTDIPPLIQIASFSLSSGYLGLLEPVKHIPLLRIENLQITIPPRDAEHREPPRTSSPLPKGISNAVIDRVICQQAVIRILPKKAGKDPLEWNIHNLTLISANSSKPFEYQGELTNGKPIGEIATHGMFGPWNAEDPGGTAITGEYKFTDANLTPLPGIGGTLSSTGKYTGILAELEVDGETDTPDFSLDAVGTPVPLHTDFQATVNGMNGDTLLHPVTATLAQSSIIAEGKVVRVPGEGHLVTIQANVPNGRIQDFLKLATRAEKPILSGPVKIKANLVFPPGKQHALDKISLDGEFGVEGGKWSSPEMRDKLASLSRHAQGKPEEQDAGSAVTDLSGSFSVRNGVLHFRELRFRVEGADVTLAGSYTLAKGELDLNGHLTLDAKLSQTTTGSKSFFLKAFDPFFEKHGAGTVLPIRISGTRDKPVFGVTVFHKTIEKPLKPNNANSR
jgi:hypothetical protein